MRRSHLQTVLSSLLVLAVISALFLFSFSADAEEKLDQTRLAGSSPAPDVLGTESATPPPPQTPSYTVSSSALPQLNIVQKRIPLTDTRKELTKEYTKMHYGYEAVYMSTPKVVVVHWTAGGSINSVYNYFYKDYISGNDDFHKKNGSVNVSSQFLVDRDGTVYQLFDETFIARHCIGMNYHAIGIENIGGFDGQEDLTEEQLQANIALIHYLEVKYPSIKLVVGHFEAAGFADYPEYYKELVNGYITGKVDPGETFIKRVREGLAKV